MTPALPQLPALAAIPALRAALDTAGSAVLAAPPGSGKTTLIPLALLEASWLAGQRIVLLEPRRLAARAAAQRMAQLLGERVGETVGYQVRFERRVSARTRVEVVTEGILARRLQSDPELPGVGLVIFDEFHERSLDADLSLALTLDARDTLRPALRLLVMSATLDAARVAALLGDAPVVEAGGQMYPVDVRYRPPKTGEPLAAAVAAGVREALAETAGDVLAFLPGGREIRACQRLLETRLTEVAVLPLHGELPAEQQDAALAPEPRGRRKVILATNIAQTSLTVEGVTAVVDGGFARVARFDLGSGADRLETERISRAAAEQRAGRAGRLAPGVAYRLWSAEQHARLPAFDPPEMLSVDLARFALELAAWGVREPGELRFLDLPPPNAWQAACTLLRALGAIDGEHRITAHGRALVRLPAPPRRGHMLLVARERGLGAAATWTAALLDERDAAGGFDLAPAVLAYAARRGDDPAVQHRVRDAAQQFRRLAAIEPAGPFDETDVARVLALAYPERIARRREGQAGVYLCADGREARLPQGEALAQQPWLAIAHWDPAPPRRIRSAAALDEATVRADFADALRWSRHIEWDAQTCAVVAEERRALGAIVLERRPLRPVPEEAVRQAMLAGLRALGLEALPWTDEARQWRARVASLRLWRRDESWPDVSDAALACGLDAWLGPYLGGCRRAEHLARLDLLAILQNLLDGPQQQRLQRLAPTHLAVPSGSRIRLVYAMDGAAPVLSVRLQELFGLERTPAVDDGRMPVMLHLLSPAHRPVQVTADLAGFWAHTYAEVRKELKARYPRHPWPDDPLRAAPAARAKARGT